jgi:hypothetical protein
VGAEVFSIVRRYLYVFLAIVCIKGIFLVADSQPAYFIGDSESYLATATIKYIPPDRSFLYGFLLRKIALASHSLQLMIVVQAFLSAIAAWLLFVALNEIFGVRLLRMAALFGVLCAVEPLQLLSERYILTEACANFLFALHFVLALFYIKRGSVWTLLSAQAVGVLLIAFRISFLPLVLINSILIPLLSPEGRAILRSLKLRSRWLAVMPSRRLALLAIHIGLSLAVSQGLSAWYQHWYGRLIHREPAVFYEDGVFLLSDFSPLIEPEDFPITDKRDAIFSSLLYDRHDPATRAEQHFLPGGLWFNIAREFPDKRQANDLARKTAMHALLRQPGGALRLSTRMFLDYFNAAALHEWLVVDEGGEGDAQMGDQTKEWLRDLYGVRAPRQYQMSLTKRWHVLARPWYWIVLCSLVLSPLLFLVRPSADRPLLILCTIAALLFFVGATLIVDHPTPRFLTSAAWLVLLLLGITFSRAKPVA